MNTMAEQVGGSIDVSSLNGKLQNIALRVWNGAIRDAIIQVMLEPAPRAKKGRKTKKTKGLPRGEVRHHWRRWDGGSLTNREATKLVNP